MTTVADALEAAGLTQAAVLVRRMLTLRYIVFEKGDFNLNIIVERTLPGTPNRFDDLLHLIYKDQEKWVHRVYVVTADPGRTWLNDPSRREGTAILMHDQQIRGGFQLGTHKGQYPCLVQTRPLSVWRDNNKDGVADYGGKIYTDSSGIQIHKAGTNSQQVEKWSAGCVVFQQESKFLEFMAIVQYAARTYGPRFSGTVLGSNTG